MPKDLGNLLGIVSSIATILSFLAFLLERKRRVRQSDLMIGFLTALSSQAKAMGQAGEEWRYDVAMKRAAPQQAKQYANTSVNCWLNIKDETEKLLHSMKTI